MRRFIYYFVVIILLSCSKKGKIESINYINGYWQIVKAENKDGEIKEYEAIIDYDYFELKNQIGFHKKVRWQPLGKYIVDALQEKVVFEQTDDSPILKFSSTFGKREEKIVILSKDELVLETQNESKFYYKKIEDKPRSNAQTVK